MHLAEVCAVFHPAAVAAVADDTAGKVVAVHRAVVFARMNGAAVVPADDAAEGVGGDRDGDGAVLTGRDAEAVGAAAGQYAAIGAGLHETAARGVGVRVVQRVVMVGRAGDIVRPADHAADAGAAGGDIGSHFAVFDGRVLAGAARDTADVVVARDRAAAGAIVDHAVIAAGDTADVVSAADIDGRKLQILDRAGHAAEQTDVVAFACDGYPGNSFRIALKDAGKRDVPRAADWRPVLGGHRYVLRQNKTLAGAGVARVDDPRKPSKIFFGCDLPRIFLRAGAAERVGDAADALRSGGRFGFRVRLALRDDLELAVDALVLRQSRKVAVVSVVDDNDVPFRVGIDRVILTLRQRRRNHNRFRFFR